jgi:hypothetical protein
MVVVLLLLPGGVSAAGAYKAGGWTATEHAYSVPGCSTTTHNTPAFRHLNVMYLYKNMHATAPVYLANTRTKRSGAAATQCHQVHYSPSSGPTFATAAVLALTLLYLLPVVEGVGLNAMDINFSPLEPIIPIVVGGAVLNIVTINIHQSSKVLHMVGLAMSKHNWHIALIQETGIIKKLHTSVHEHWWQTLQHLILFNSPNDGYLAAKQKNRKMELYCWCVSNGSMTKDQLKEKLDQMAQYTTMPKGGMAIMINKNIAQYVQNHKITKISNGVPRKNKRLMGVSLSINHRYVLLLNTYAPAKGRKKNDGWMAK